jgi:putative transposase
MNELRTRGVQDVLIAVVDGLNGFPDAINAVFPQTRVQTCIVHLLRHALSFAPWKDRRELAAALRPIYAAVNAEAAREALEDFAAGAHDLRTLASLPPNARSPHCSVRSACRADGAD